MSQTSQEQDSGCVMTSEDFLICSCVSFPPIFFFQHLSLLCQSKWRYTSGETLPHLTNPCHSDILKLGSFPLRSMDHEMDQRIRHNHSWLTGPSNHIYHCFNGKYKELNAGKIFCLISCILIIILTSKSLDVSCLRMNCTMIWLPPFGFWTVLTMWTGLWDRTL